MKKIVVFLSKKGVVSRSGVGKYLFDYFTLLEKDFDIEYFYQPDDSNISWRFFTLPKIIEKQYANHIKVFLDELFLTAVNAKNCSNTISIVQHYPYLVPVKNLNDFLIKILTYFYFKRLKYVTRIVSGSDFTAGVLENYLHVPASKITTIPSAFDPKTYSPLPVEQRGWLRSELAKKYGIPALESDNKIVLYVGTNDSRKNMVTLAVALGGISNSLFVHIGKKISKSEQRKIDFHMKKGGVEAYSIPTINEEDLIGFYRVADVFPFPSLYEGFGRPPVEAQLCGCPVITTHCGSLKTVIAESALILQNPMDADELHQAIQRVLSDEQLRETLIEKGLENGKRFSLEQGYENWRGLILELAK